jgi:hypothetical protein
LGHRPWDSGRQNRRPDVKRFNDKTGRNPVGNWSMNAAWSKKPLWGNNLRRFGGTCLRRACLRESGFVNHSWIMSNQFVPKAFLTFAAIAALT